MAVEWSYWQSPPTINKNVWMDMINSGNSSLLKNSHLRHSISEYYESEETRLKYYEDSWIKQNDKAKMLNSRILPWNDRMTLWNSFYSFVDGSMSEKPKISVDFDFIKKKLDEQSNLESILTSVLMGGKVSVDFGTNGVKIIEEILNIIDQEIERWN